MVQMHIRKTLETVKALSSPRARLAQCVAASLLLAFSASAQDALRNNVAIGEAQQARSLQEQSSDYTYKNGAFRLSVVPSLDMQWIDNINLSSTNVEDDFVIRPTVGITTSYPISEQNLLSLNLTAGYSTYLKHSSESSFYLSSGSGLSFDVYVKDVLINLHDQFSYEQDSSQNSAVANTGTYGTFQNSAGLSASWDLDTVTLSAGYDHQNVLATSSGFDGTDHSAEMFFARAGYNVSSRLVVGLEASASLTTYDQDILNNNQSYSLGVYANFKPDSYFQFQPRAGYTISQFQQTSTNLTTSNLKSWYADLDVTHAITKAISYSVDAGRSVGLGVQSDATETYYVTPSVTWNLRKDWTINASMSYNYGQQGVGSTLSPSLPPELRDLLVSSEDYSWYTGTLGFSHAITRRFDFSFNYRVTLRSSSGEDRGYTQNQVELQLSYHPL